MNSVPTLAVLNPIWLWLFRHGFEDPGWGHRPAEQHALALVIHELAERVDDAEARAQIQYTAASVLLKNSEALVRQSTSKADPS